MFNSLAAQIYKFKESSICSATIQEKLTCEPAFTSILVSATFLMVFIRQGKLSVIERTFQWCLLWSKYFDNSFYYIILFLP